MSFYQLTKVLIAPSQALFQYLWYSKPSSLQAIGALATMTVGIGMLFVTDLHATPTSLLYGFAGVFFCTIAQAVLFFSPFYRHTTMSLSVLLFP